MASLGRWRFCGKCGKVPKMDITDLIVKLGERLRGQLEVNGCVVDIVRISAGASQETWRFSLGRGDDADHNTYILRRNPGGISSNKDSTTGALGAVREAQVIMAARAGGLAAPDVVHICDAEDGLGSAFVMRYIAGETIPRKILRDPAFDRVRSTLATQAGEMLAALHASTPPSDLHHSLARDELTKYEAILRTHGHPHPVFDLVLHWLDVHCPPPPSRACFVHGDFRNGNLIVDRHDGIVALLDWELAHCGDPMEDLGWISVPSWRFGVHDQPIGGFGTRADFCAAYEAAGGLIRYDDMRFWEVLGTLKWGIMCTMMVDIFEAGHDRSVERAAIGRRASETEIDLLLNLIEAD